jgi:hypothetical protein
MLLKLACLLSMLLGQAQKGPSQHFKRDVEGWKVLVDTRLFRGENRATGARALRLLATQLDVIKARMQPDRVHWLQSNVRIFLEMECGEQKQPVYHPSAVWLKENGYSTALEKAVHIPVAVQFIGARFQMQQPMSVLHEMAHAYHDQKLSFENAEIKQAWEKFKASKKYEMVQRSTLDQRPHYGLTNQMEFFAEFTESYFGGNDFFPFTQGELYQTEPEIYELMKRIWGPTP